MYCHLMLQDIDIKNELFVAHIAYRCFGILSTDALKAVGATTHFRTDRLIVGRKCSSTVDHWQRVQSDMTRFAIQRTERCEAAQTAGFRLKPRFKSQVVNNHEISRVTEPRTPNIQRRRSVEAKTHLNYQIALGASTAPQSDNDL